MCFLIRINPELSGNMSGRMEEPEKVGETPEMHLQVGSLILQEEKDSECLVPGALMDRPQWKRMQVEDRGEESGGVLEHVGWPEEWRLPQGCLR